MSWSLRSPRNLTSNVPKEETCWTFFSPALIPKQTKSKPPRPTLMLSMPQPPAFVQIITIRKWKKRPRPSPSKIPTNRREVWALLRTFKWINSNQDRQQLSPLLRKPARKSGLAAIRLPSGLKTVSRGASPETKNVSKKRWTWKTSHRLRSIIITPRKTMKMPSQMLLTQLKNREEKRTGVLVDL